MMNSITMMGRLCAPVTLRMTQSGIPVASLRIAVDRDYKTADGQTTTDFFNVTCWRNTAQFASKYFTTGDMIALNGRLQTSNWTANDGSKRTSVEVLAEQIYFAGANRRDAAPQNAMPQSTEPQNTAQQGGAYAAA